MAMEGVGCFSKTVRRTYNDSPYVLSASGDAESLNLEAEHAEDGRRWRATFAASFIEEITRRTGNNKKFDVFVKMLLSALAQESDAVYLDVLTQRDLEMLRRHANPQGPPSASATGQSDDKRFVILTYRAEFDKVHYPLPLPFDERSSEETQQALVSRLRGELGEARARIASLEASLAAAPPPGPRSKDEDLERRLAAAQQKNTELSDALRTARWEIEQMRGELKVRPAAGNAGNDGDAPKLRQQIARQQAELKALREEARQKAQDARREAEKTSKELRAERQRGDKLDAQVRRLEEQRRQGAGAGAGGGRAASAERSRNASRTPSVERARPPSRPVPAAGPSRYNVASGGAGSRQPSRPGSRAASRASSAASSRDRTPSPGASRRGLGPVRQGYPGARPGAPPNANLSPYRLSVAVPGAARRTPSPGRGRERTPSPGRAATGGAAAGVHASVAARRSPALSLRDPAGHMSGAIGTGPPKPSSSRYGGGGGGYGPPATMELPHAARRDASEQGRGGSASAESASRPGSLFGIAAKCGLAPGAGAGAPCGLSVNSSADAVVDDSAIDARLQALQAFLKQTKHLTD